MIIILCDKRWRDDRGLNGVCTDRPQLSSTRHVGFESAVVRYTVGTEIGRNNVIMSSNDPRGHCRRTPKNHKILYD